MWKVQNAELVPTNDPDASLFIELTDHGGARGLAWLNVATDPVEVTGLPNRPVLLNEDYTISGFIEQEADAVDRLLQS